MEVRAYRESQQLQDAAKKEENFATLDRALRFLAGAEHQSEALGWTKFHAKAFGKAEAEAAAEGGGCSLAAHSHRQHEMWGDWQEFIVDSLEEDEIDMDELVEFLETDYALATLRLDVTGHAALLVNAMTTYSSVRAACAACCVHKKGICMLPAGCDVLLLTTTLHPP